MPIPEAISAQDALIHLFPGDMDVPFANAVLEVVEELVEARKRYPAMNSSHEGWAVIYEELDELWDECRVKTDEHRYMAMRKEARQIAAMAIRFMLDVRRK